MAAFGLSAALASGLAADAVPPAFGDTAPQAVSRASGAAPAVRRPRSGRYVGFAGGRRNFELYIAGSDVLLVAIPFACRRVSGRIALNDIPMRRTRRGYVFSIRAHGSITYSDNQPDQNGRVEIGGRFSRLGTSASGYVRVRGPRCPTNALVRWTARR